MSFLFLTFRDVEEPSQGNKTNFRYKDNTEQFNMTINEK